MTDVSKEKRNFPGWEKHQYYTMEDIVSGDTSGTTDTDYETDTGSGHKGYTKINMKHGKKHG